jgi:hypothetical protein
VKCWIAGVGAKTAYIEKASPWENGYVESFNGELRDELLNREVFNCRNLNLISQLRLGGHPPRQVDDRQIRFRLLHMIVPLSSRPYGYPGKPGAAH